MNKALQDDRMWLVWLYRRESDGWKKQESSPSSISKKNETTTTVAPRKDCIIFPALRQRFSLKSTSDHGTVIRRGEKIILVSKRRARALLLQFQSLEECLSFSDQFVRLNRKLPLEPLPSNGNKLEDEHSLSVCQQQYSGSKKSQAILGDKTQREIVSWIVKMLHDESFLNYVEKIEHYITETEDGIKMLQALGQTSSFPAYTSQS